MVISATLLAYESVHDNYKTLGKASNAFFKAHVADLAITVAVTLIGIIGLQIGFSSTVAYMLVGGGVTSLVINMMVFYAVRAVMETWYGDKQLEYYLEWVEDNWNEIMVQEGLNAMRQRIEGRRPAPLTTLIRESLIFHVYDLTVDSEEIRRGLEDLDIPLEYSLEWLRRNWDNPEVQIEIAEMHQRFLDMPCNLD